MIDSEILAVKAQLSRADAENARLRKALERIQGIVHGDPKWHHPQYGSLTSAGESEILRLVALALKAPASGH